VPCATLLKHTLAWFGAAVSCCAAPIHRDDWQAQLCEETQSVQDFSPSFTPTKTFLSLLPIVEDSQGSHRAGDEVELPIQALHEYMEAFYDRPVRVLDAIRVSPPATVRGLSFARHATPLPPRRRACAVLLLPGALFAPPTYRRWARAVVSASK